MLQILFSLKGTCRHRSSVCMKSMLSVSVHLHNTQQRNGCGEWTRWRRESSEIRSGFQVQTNIWKLFLPLHPARIMTHFPSLARWAIPITLPCGLILPSGTKSTKDCSCFAIKSFVRDLPLMKSTSEPLTTCCNSYLRECFEKWKEREEGSTGLGL